MEFNFKQGKYGYFLYLLVKIKKYVSCKPIHAIITVYCMRVMAFHRAREFCTLMACGFKLSLILVVFIPDAAVLSADRTFFLYLQSGTLVVVVNSHGYI